MSSCLAGLPLLAVLLAPADAPKPDRNKQDLANLQGTWAIVEMEAEGKKLPKEDYKDVKWVFQGNKLIAVQGNKRVELATLTIDANKEPRWMDTTGIGEEGDKLMAIYQLAGDDLKICLSKKEGDRPAKFATTEGKEHGLIVLKREKP